MSRREQETEDGEGPQEIPPLELCAALRDDTVGAYYASHVGERRSVRARIS